LAVALADEFESRHWTGPAGCWCETRHQEGEAGLTLAAPPWDESRGVDAALKAVGL
jgi:hypothetical protein